MKIEKIDLNGKKNSIEVLYSLPINTFTLVADYNDNIFVAKTVNYEEQKISENSDESSKVNTKKQLVRKQKLKENKYVKWWGG